MWAHRQQPSQCLDRADPGYQRGENKTTVLVLDAQNRVQTRDVQVGVESSNNVEILGGLNEGERVVVGNLGSYQPGQTVKPKESEFTVASGNAETE